MAAIPLVSREKILCNDSNADLHGRFPGAVHTGLEDDDVLGCDWSQKVNGIHAPGDLIFCGKPKMRLRRAEVN